MTNAKDIRTIIGITGTIINSLISLSQIPSFREIYEKRTVKHDPPQVHLAMIFSCSLLSLFGLPFIQKDHILVTITYGVGFLMEVIYFVLFLKYSEDQFFEYFGDKFRKEEIRTILAGKFVFVAFIFGGSCVWKMLGISDRREAYLGGGCVVFTPLTLVFKTECDSSVGLSLASFVNAGIWITYSLIYKIDEFLLVINIVGALFYAGRFIVDAYNYKSHAAMAKVHPQILIA